MPEIALMSNALTQLAWWEAEFVFVKTMLGSKNTGRFGLYDNRIIVLSDLSIIDPKDVVFVAGVHLNDAILAATEKGVYYTSWMFERNIWLWRMDFQDHITTLVKSFDLKWHRVAATFIVSPPKKKPEPKPTEDNLVDTAFSDMFNALTNSRVRLTPMDPMRSALYGERSALIAKVYLHRNFTTARASRAIGDKRQHEKLACQAEA